MKIVVYGPERRVGALAGDRVIDLNRAAAQLPARLLNFIEAGKPALDGAAQASEKFAKAPTGDGIVHALGSVQLSRALAGTAYRLCWRQLRQASARHVGEPLGQN